MLEERLHTLYNTFNGLPSNKSIVRNNQPNDAFTILTYEILFRHIHETNEFGAGDLYTLTKCIVPPPDNGIDIFIQQFDGDEIFYHIVQVKYTSLAEHEIKNCFSQMKRTIEDYCYWQVLLEKFRQIILLIFFHFSYLII